MVLRRNDEPTVSRMQRNAHAEVTAKPTRHAACTWGRAGGLGAFYSRRWNSYVLPGPTPP